MTVRTIAAVLPATENLLNGPQFDFGVRRMDRHRKTEPNRRRARRSHAGSDPWLFATALIVGDAVLVALTRTENPPLRAPDMGDRFMLGYYQSDGDD